MHCAVCEAPSSGEIICKICFSCLTLTKYINFCQYCGIKLSVKYHLCPNETKYFDTVFAVFMYDDTIAKLVYKFKYSDAMYLIKYCAKYMLDHSAKILNDVELIVPVPMHRIKLFQRKYNQAALLAKHIGKISSIKVDYTILKKIKNTRSQASLSFSDRKTNLNGAFKAINSKEIHGKIICLVDDVFTTGSTVLECAKALAMHKPKKIKVISLARAIKS